MRSARTGSECGQRSQPPSWEQESRVPMIEQSLDFARALAARSIPAIALRFTLSTGSIPPSLRARCPASTRCRTDAWQSMSSCACGASPLHGADCSNEACPDHAETSPWLRAVMLEIPASHFDPVWDHWTGFATCHRFHDERTLKAAHHRADTLRANTHASSASRCRASKHSPSREHHEPNGTTVGPPIGVRHPPDAPSVARRRTETSCFLDCALRCKFITAIKREGGSLTACQPPKNVKVRSPMSLLALPFAAAITATVAENWERRRDLNPRPPRPYHTVRTPHTDGCRKRGALSV